MFLHKQVPRIVLGMRLETGEGRRGPKTWTARREDKEDEAGGQVLGRSVTTGRQKFNKRQSGSLHILGEGLSVLLIRADDPI